MAQSFGGWQNHGRVWFDYAVAPISQGSTHTTVTIYGYFQVDSSSYINGTWSKSWWGGWGSGSAGQTYNMSPNQSILLVSSSFSVALSDSAQYIGFGAQANHFFGSSSASVDVYIPPRYALTPTALGAAWVSDSQINLTWTRNSTYSSVVVQRQTDDGLWQQVAAPVGNLATYSDTTTATDRKYAYRVAGVGGSGQSAWSDPVTINTSPAAPVGATATREGLTVKVSATTVPPYATSFDVRRNGTQVAAGVSLPWTDTAPGAGTVSYTIRGKLTTQGTVLTGDWSEASNSVTIIAKPNQPTNLKPTGIVAVGATSLSWLHNPVDTSTQTTYELRWNVGGGAWTTLSGTIASTRDVTLPVGAVMWQVRTKGSHADFSDWSAVSTLTVINLPTAAINVPGPTHTQPVLTVTWGYAQAQSQPQSAWRVFLRTPSGEQIEYREGAGASNSVTLNTLLSNTVSYVVQVQVAAGGVWSTVTSQAFTVGFIPPDNPLLHAVWSEDTGSVTVTFDVGEDGTKPATASLSLERSIDDGKTWEPIITGGAAQETVVADFESLTNGDTLYRCVALTSIGAGAQTIVTCVARSSAVWLGGGPGFSMCGRLPFDPKIAISAGRARSVQQYAGRSLPVAYAGEAVVREVKISGTIMDESDYEITAGVTELERIAQAVEPVFVIRDPDSRRIYGVIGAIELPRENAITGGERGWIGVWGYSVSLTETSK